MISICCYCIPAHITEGRCGHCASTNMTVTPSLHVYCFSCGKPQPMMSLSHAMCDKALVDAQREAGMVPAKDSEPLNPRVGLLILLLSGCVSIWALTWLARTVFK